MFSTSFEDLSFPLRQEDGDRIKPTKRRKCILLHDLADAEASIDTSVNVSQLPDDVHLSKYRLCVSAFAGAEDSNLRRSGNDLDAVRFGDINADLNNSDLFLSSDFSSSSAGLRPVKTMPDFDLFRISTSSKFDWPHQSSIGI
ncbi:hypothetical protein R1sor_021321 [Riccia sorocarpa]|uniref:Uncharacterized protein n=1 Tax=Riccia sorocarpa TaxID=122646 RepID=A0ABD3GJW1_9MARC